MVLKCLTTKYLLLLNDHALDVPTLGNLKNNYVLTNYFSLQFTVFPAFCLKVYNRLPGLRIYITFAGAGAQHNMQGDPTDAPHRIEILEEPMEFGYR